MPANKCSNGKWKWGDSGACKYDTKQEAENDNSNYREKIGTIISDGIELPLFETIQEAEKEAEKLGGNGYHEHEIDGKIYYMPFESHEDAIKILKGESKKIKRVWDKKYNNTIMEKRIFKIENRFETKDDGKEVVIGYGSIWDSRSENLGGFYEFISPTAITNETIERSDVRALINHNPDLVLARSTAGNLNLSVDEKGLRYEFSIPETSYGKDLAINMKNGNINQSSFAFTVGDDVWSTDDEGNDIRTITKIDRLFDVSPVTYPAYSQAESDLVVAQRGLAMYKEKQEIKEEENDLVARSLAKLKIELIKRKK